MADPKRRDARNVEGAWFVDTTCIACDACRQCAPRVFREHGDGTSSVQRQPVSDDDKLGAARAMLACPVGAIGKERVPGNGPVKITGLFPQELDAGLWYCGYNSTKSYGGNGYLVDVDGALFMIDAPRFVTPVVDFIQARGGLRAILLTHGDDVGDSERYAAKLSCPVLIHEADAHAAPFASSTWKGLDVRPAVGGVAGLTMIPVPGHTRGSVVFLAGDRLFTGDSLAWSRGEERLMAFDDACWFSWSEQARSLARLVDVHFTWVLPGHGQRHRQSTGENRRMLGELVARMRA